MQVSVVEESKDKLKVEVKGESVSLTQLIASEIWKADGQSAAFKEHLFMSEPKILVEGSNPRKLLEKAAKSIEGKTDEMKDELKRALKESPATKEPARAAGIESEEEPEFEGGNKPSDEQ